MARFILFLVFSAFMTFSFEVCAQVKDSFYFMKGDGEFSAEEKDEEAQYVYDQCEANAIQGIYFQCECIAGAFRAARDDGPLVPQSNLIYSLFKDKARECINKPAIAGEAYDFCQNHSRIFRSREPDNEQYCECVARQSVKEFSKDPKLRSRFISKVHVNAMSACTRRRS